MSMLIHIEKVSEVLLADGWKPVKQDKEDGNSFSSFDFDAYEFYSYRDAETGDYHMAYEGGVGASWTTPSGEKIACPISSILAVRYKR